MMEMGMWLHWSMPRTARPWPTTNTAPSVKSSEAQGRWPGTTPSSFPRSIMIWNRASITTATVSTILAREYGQIETQCRNKGGLICMGLLVIVRSIMLIHSDCCFPLLVGHLKRALGGTIVFCILRSLVPSALSLFLIMLIMARLRLDSLRQDSHLQKLQRLRLLEGMLVPLRRIAMGIQLQ